MQNKPNFLKAKMNANAFSQKDYENENHPQAPKKQTQSKPISEKAKTNANAFSQKVYENKTAFRLEQNKPKQSRGIKRVRSIFRRFILVFLTQTPHINITTPIFDPKKRTPPKMNKKNLKKPNFPC